MEILSLLESVSSSTVSLSESLENTIEAPLPLPDGVLPFEEFLQKFSLGALSTEQLCSTTLHLSQTLHQDLQEGMKLLLEVDQSVLEGFEKIAPQLQQKALEIAELLQKGGRVFLVGAGSSGRVGFDLAAKLTEAYPHLKGRITAVIAGGDSAFIRAKEGFEDSISSGEDAIFDFKITPQDSVILISASGSASFNVGAGHHAANEGAHVSYFYNSTKVPQRTQGLFERNHNPVDSLCIDIGPQAVTGSTRLQGASIAEMCLGSMLSFAIEPSKDSYFQTLLDNMNAIQKLIESHLKPIGALVQAECQIFSSPYANFRRIQDETDQGYVTFLAGTDSLREVLIDSTETPPTFCTTAPRRETEPNKQRADFRAYLIGEESHDAAWEALLGRAVQKEFEEDVSSFLLGSKEVGATSFLMRPKGEGNLTIGVQKIPSDTPLSGELLEKLQQCSSQGGETGLILLCEGSLDPVERQAIEEQVKHPIIFENVPKDQAGLSQTLLLKQTLNLISNSSMVLMNKVQGNLMVDVKASNNKLIDRSIRLVKKIFEDHHFNSSLTDEQLYYYVTHISEKSNAYAEQGRYVPSVVKMTVAMRLMNKKLEDFDEVASFLLEQNENLEALFEAQG